MEGHQWIKTPLSEGYPDEIALQDGKQYIDYLFTKVDDMHSCGFNIFTAPREPYHSYIYNVLYYLGMMFSKPNNGTRLNWMRYCYKRIRQHALTFIRTTIPLYTLTIWVKKSRDHGNHSFYVIYLERPPEEKEGKLYVWSNERNRYLPEPEEHTRLFDIIYSMKV
jgi:hypothetical protein